MSEQPGQTRGILEGARRRLSRAAGHAARCPTSCAPNCAPARRSIRRRGASSPRSTRRRSTQVKVVILGQDPYHGPGQAHGLCFSVLPGVPPPPSLVNIFAEIQRDLGIPRPDHGCLLPWARQGVLLLNAVLTVERGLAGSHQGKGWEGFTDAVVDHLNREREGLVFLLWGSYAQAKGQLDRRAPPSRAQGAASVAAVGASRLYRLRAFFADKSMVKREHGQRRDRLAPAARREALRSTLLNWCTIRYRNPACSRLELTDGAGTLNYLECQAGTRRRTSSMSTALVANNLPIPSAIGSRRCVHQRRAPDSGADARRRTGAGASLPRRERSGRGQASGACRTCASSCTSRVATTATVCRSPT